MAIEDEIEKKDRIDRDVGTERDPVQKAIIDELCKRLVDTETRLDVGFYTSDTTTKHRDYLYQRRGPDGRWDSGQKEEGYLTQTTYGVRVEVFGYAPYAVVYERLVELESNDQNTDREHTRIYPVTPYPAFHIVELSDHLDAGAFYTGHSIDCGPFIRGQFRDISDELIEEIFRYLNKCIPRIPDEYRTKEARAAAVALREEKIATLKREREKEEADRARRAREAEERQKEKDKQKKIRVLIIWVLAIAYWIGFAFWFFNLR